MKLTINIKDKSKEKFLIDWLLQYDFIEFSIPEYENLEFLTPEQNEELKRRLVYLEKGETEFIRLEDFKEKYNRYVED